VATAVADPITGANGSAGANSTTAVGGNGGDGANAPGSGGAGATAALGAPGIAGSNGTGGGGGGGGRDYSGGYPYGGAGGNSEFSAGGFGGTTVAPAGGGGEEAGGGGGYGGLASGSTGGGGGGGGGRGATISTSTATILATDPVTGGNGGDGGDGVGGYGDGGGGGGGGIGLVFTGATSLTVSGTITGGEGGKGGDAPSGSTFGGNGGAGGTGLRVTQPGTTIWVNAAITGGAGGAIGQGNYTPIRSVPGAGGAGIVGSGITVITTSSISGGLSGNAATRADAITFAGGANTLTLDTGWSLTGNIGINGIGTTATFAQTTIDASVANIITGTGGLIVDDGGMGHVLTLTGVNAYTGATAVDSGKLVVNGSIASSSSVNVGDGGAIGGSGTVSDLILNNGSKLAPGNSIGTLNAASATFNAGMTYEVEVNGAGASDLLNVAGTTTINGGKVVVVPFPDLITGTPYTIITSAGGIAGVFSGSDIANAPLLAAALSYDANNVYVTIDQLAFTTLALTPNQTAAAGAAESLGAGNPIYDAILGVPTADGVRQAFDTLSGEVHASIHGVLIEDSRYVRDAVFARLLQTSYAGRGSSQLALAGAPASARMSLGATNRDKGVPSASGLAFWGQAYGAWGDIGGNGNAAKVDRTLGGFVTGVDAGLDGGWRAGLATGYAHSSLDVDARLSSGSIDSYHLVGYLGGRVGAFALRGGAAWTWNDIETSRTIAFAGFLDHAASSYDGDTGQVFGEVALPLRYGAAALEPFARLAYVKVDTDGFSESGGAAALSSAGGNESIGYSTLGVRVAATARLAGLLVTPHASVGWQHAIGDIEPAQTLAFASGGATFTVLGAPLARDSAIIDAGLSVAVAPDAVIGLSYSGQLAGDVADNAITGRIDLQF
jgi:outer membrane autotransporter protein